MAAADKYPLPNFYNAFLTALNVGKPIAYSFIYFQRIAGYLKQHSEDHQCPYCVLEFEEPIGSPEWLVTRGTLCPCYQTVNLIMDGKKVASTRLIRFDKCINECCHTFYIPQPEDYKSQNYIPVCDYLNGKGFDYEEYYAAKDQLMERL